MLVPLIFAMPGLCVSRDVGGSHYRAGAESDPGGLVPSQSHLTPWLPDTQTGHLGWLLRHPLQSGESRSSVLSPRAGESF